MTMRVLCGVGRHRAMPVRRWNEGYCFSRCARCGCDLVREPHGRWRVPSGYRIVWKPRSEVQAERARRARQAEAAAYAAPRSRAMLPIDSVLQSLRGTGWNQQESRSAASGGR